MSDRIFTMAFITSLGIHLSVLVLQLFASGWCIDWFHASRSKPTALEVIYEEAQLKQQLDRMKDELMKTKREALTAPAPGAAQNQPMIRIPDRPFLATAQAIQELAPGRSAIVDLTNLLDASKGDPVLLSYFGTIREQIQRAANRKDWLTGTERQGLVYVSFILTAEGRIRSATVIGNRSVSSATLQDIALKIIGSAAPFPPFPPSLQDTSKTLIVPLEFLLEPVS